MAPVPDAPAPLQALASKINKSAAVEYPTVAPPDVSEDDMVDQGMSSSF